MFMSALMTQIIISFTSDSYPLRIIFATVAFGMGLNCPAVSHFGAPDDPMCCDVCVSVGHVRETLNH